MVIMVQAPERYAAHLETKGGNTWDCVGDDVDRRPPPKDPPPPRPPPARETYTV